jgi:hypothetical protein
MCALTPYARLYILFTGSEFESEEEFVPVSKRARAAGKTKVTAARGKAPVQGGTSDGRRAHRNTNEPTCND